MDKEEKNNQEKVADASESQELKLKTDEIIANTSKNQLNDSDSDSSEELEVELDTNDDSDSEELELTSNDIDHEELTSSDSDSEELELTSNGSNNDSDETQSKGSKKSAELQIIQQFSTLDQQLIIAIFLSGLSKTQLAKDIYDTCSEEQHQKVTKACSEIQQKLINNIQKHWDDSTYEQLYKDLQHLLKTTAYYLLPNEEKPKKEEGTLAIFLHLSKPQLQLVVAIFLNGFSKTQLSKEIFAKQGDDYKIDHHVRVTDMLSALQKRMVELIKTLWDDEAYQQMYSTLAENL